MISVKDIKITESKYDETFLDDMKALDIDCPKLGVESSFRIVGKAGIPTHTIANAIRAGITDELEVLCLNVDTGVDVSKSNITTNSPYFINQIFVRYVLNLIPIRQVANRKFMIDVKNDTGKFRLVTSADIVPMDDEKKASPMFNDGYHIAILPPHTFLHIQNIISTPGVGYRDGIGHSYAIRVGYSENVPEQDYTITTTPTTLVEPSQLIAQVCRAYITQFIDFRKIVDQTTTYSYVDKHYKISKPFDNLVVYQWNMGCQVKGSMIEEFGQMLDPSHDTIITYNIIHNTINGIEIKIRHTNAKKYLCHILDTLIKIFETVSESFAK